MQWQQSGALLPHPLWPRACPRPLPRLPHLLAAEGAEGVDENVQRQLVARPHVHPAAAAPEPQRFTLSLHELALAAARACCSRRAQQVWDQLPPPHMHHRLAQTAPLHAAAAHSPEARPGAHGLCRLHLVHGGGQVHPASPRLPHLVVKVCDVVRPVVEHLRRRRASGGAVSAASPLAHSAAGRAPAATAGTGACCAEALHS